MLDNAETILIILPDWWDFKKVRYVKRPVGQPYAMDLRAVPTPLESEESLFNYPIKVIKEYGKWDNPPETFNYGKGTTNHAKNCDGWHHPKTGHCEDCGCFSCSSDY